jgi:CheY-like chemotaxis protein
MLPDLDGLDVLKAIRADSELENLPVVVLTARSSNEDIFTSYHYGADMHLLKPFNPEDFCGWLYYDPSVWMPPVTRVPPSHLSNTKASAQRQLTTAS